MCTLGWGESNELKERETEEEIEGCGWSRIRYTGRERRRGGAKQSVERSGIAIFRDGAWRDERDKVGGEEGRRKKSGEHMECKRTYHGESGTLSNTLRRFFYVGAFRVPLRCRIITELRL